MDLDNPQQWIYKSKEKLNVYRKRISKNSAPRFVETLNSAQYGVALKPLERVAIFITTISLRKTYSLSLVLLYRKAFQISRRV